MIFGPLIQFMKRQRENAFESWMLSNDVWWAKDLICISQDGVVHGFGVLASKQLQPGVTLFRIPRKACFGAKSRKEEENESKDENVELIDSQERFAKLMLESINGPWQPLIETLPDYKTYQDLPWLWSDWREELKATQLLQPVESKRKRLHEEFDALPQALKEQLESFDQYAQLCGVVMSHLNPYFGGSMVPFTYMLNFPNQLVPNVEFRVDEDDDDFVIGVTIRAIEKNAELTQSYGEDLAAVDMIYRCGFFVDAFATLDTNIISFQVESFDGLESSQIELLRYLSIAQSSPWDGLEGVMTIEIGKHNWWELYLTAFVTMIPQAEVAKLLEIMEEPDSESDSDSDTDSKDVDMSILDTYDSNACQFVAWMEGGKLDASYRSKLTNARKKYRGDDDPKNLLWEFLLSSSAITYNQSALQLLKTLLETRITDLSLPIRKRSMIKSLCEIELDICKHHLSKVNSNILKG